MYSIHFNVIFRYIDLLWEGLQITFHISVLVMLFGTLIGLLIAVGRSSKNPFVLFLFKLYIEFFRNVPLILILYIVFYGIPSFSKQISFSAFWASVIALSLNSSAYEAEIIRGGINGISKEEIEAAFSLSLSKFQVYYYIVIPHALRLIWDALGNQLVAIILGSSITSIITLNELTYQALGVGSKTSRYFEVFIILLIVYVVLSFFLSSLFRLIKKTFLKPTDL